MPCCKWHFQFCEFRVRREDFFYRSSFYSWRLQDSLRLNYVYDAVTGNLVERSKATPIQLRADAEAQFMALATQHAKEKARLDKQVQRLSLLTRGYEERASALNRGIAAASTDRVDEQIKLSCFAALAAGEESALANRLATAQASMTTAALQERELQARYASQLREIDGLRQRLITAGIEV